MALGVPRSIGFHSAWDRDTGKTIRPVGEGESTTAI